MTGTVSAHWLRLRFWGRVIVSDWTLTLLTSHKEEPLRTFWFTEIHGRWTWLNSGGLNWGEKRNLMSLWKGLMSLCMVWLTWLFAVFCFYFFVFFICFLGVCVRLFAVVFAFILRTEFSLYQSVTLLNLQRFLFKYSMFVLTPRSLPFFHPPPSSDLAEGSVCQSCHSCFEVG